MVSDQISAELWEFDPFTSTWTELLVGGSSLPPRDEHSASVLGSRMIIFGGRGSATNATGASTGGQDDLTLLGDAWEIDLDPSRNVAAEANGSKVRLDSAAVRHNIES